eukprot:jgi/Mesvir1/23560/Mv18256-RA.2
MEIATIQDDPRDGGAGSGGQESVVVEKRGEHAAYCKWTLAQFTKVKARALWSRYFEVGGYDCRLLVYPRGDSQALPGYLSIYLQVTDPRGSSTKWDCFASYRLCVVNQRDESKSIQRDSWHRFSSKKKSHGWCDFTPSSTIMESRSGFLVNDTVLITAEILVLNESVTFTRDNDVSTSSGISPGTPEVLSGKFTWKVFNFSLFKEMIKTQKIMSPVFPAGECNLRLSVYQSSVNGVEYLSMCLESKDTEKSTQVERSCWCLFRMSVLNQRLGRDHMHRDSYGRFAADNKSGDNTSLGWNDYMKMGDFMGADSGYLLDDCAVFSASFHIIKESSTFSKNLGAGAGWGLGSSGGGGASNSRALTGGGGNKKVDNFMGKFLWRIEHFTKLKDLLKKRKITGLCIKSRRFQVGGRDCRLIVYPRGQSQPPCHLSMFLEVTDPRHSASASDWSCFVSHRLSVVNQKVDERSVTKESQNRYSKSAKDWGWREFVTLTSLFDQDSGFLVADTVAFSAEVLILKEQSLMDGKDADSMPASNAAGGANASGGALTAGMGLGAAGSSSAPLGLPTLSGGASVSSSGGSGAASSSVGGGFLPSTDASVSSGGAGGAHGACGGAGTSSTCSSSGAATGSAAPGGGNAMVASRPRLGSGGNGGHGTFTWKVENFLVFKEIMETRKIFSKYFQAGTCDLRIGVYESFDTLCIYLESDSLADAERNYWVRYRIAVLNQRHPDRTLWKESSICTRTWNNSVLQFMKVSDMLEPDAGFLVRDTVVFVCEVLDCCPWFEFADLEMLAYDDEHETMSTDPEELLDSDESEGASGDEEDLFRTLLARAGFHLSYGDNPPTLLDPSQLQVTLREKLLMDAGAVAAFLAGLRVHLDDPHKVKKLLLPTVLSSSAGAGGHHHGHHGHAHHGHGHHHGHHHGKGGRGKGGAGGNGGASGGGYGYENGGAHGGDAAAGGAGAGAMVHRGHPNGASAGGNGTATGTSSSPSLMNLLMGVKVLQQAIVDLLLDIMVECVTDGGSSRRGGVIDELLAGKGGEAGGEGAVVSARGGADAVVGSHAAALSSSSGDSGAVAALPPTPAATTPIVEKEGGKVRGGGSSATSLSQGVDVGRFDDAGGTCGSSSSLVPSSSSAGGAGRQQNQNCVRSDFAAAATSSSLTSAPPHLPPPPPLLAHGDPAPARSHAPSSQEGGASASGTGHGSHKTSQASPSSPHEGGGSSGGPPMPKWPEQSDELLGLIVNSLHTLDNVVPHGVPPGCLEPRRRPQSAAKIATILAKAPAHLRCDIISLIPKLVDASEHARVAGILLDQLRVAEAEEEEEGDEEEGDARAVAPGGAQDAGDATGAWGAEQGDGGERERRATSGAAVQERLSLQGAAAQVDTHGGVEGVSADGVVGAGKDELATAPAGVAADGSEASAPPRKRARRSGMLHIPVLQALSQLSCLDSDVALPVLAKALEVLPSTESESQLVTVVGFIFRAAVEEGSMLDKAIRAVRSRIKQGGGALSHRVLELLCGTIASTPDVAAVLLRDIDADCRRLGAEPYFEDEAMPGQGAGMQASSTYGASAVAAGKAAGGKKGGAAAPDTAGAAGSGPGSGTKEAGVAPAGATAAGTDVSSGPLAGPGGMFSVSGDGSNVTNVLLPDDSLAEPPLPLSPECMAVDVNVLLEAMCLPSLARDARAVFERAVDAGLFSEPVVLAVLERRRAQRMATEASATGKAATGAPSSPPTTAGVAAGLASAPSSALLHAQAPATLLPTSPAAPAPSSGVSAGRPGTAGAAAQGNPAGRSQKDTATRAAAGSRPPSGSGASVQMPAQAGSKGSVAASAPAAGAASAPLEGPTSAQMVAASGAVVSPHSGAAAGANSTSAGAVYIADEFALVAELADDMARSRHARARAFSCQLYSLLFHTYPEPAHRELILHALIDKVVNAPLPSASALWALGGLGPVLPGMHPSLMPPMPAASTGSMADSSAMLMPQAGGPAAWGVGAPAGMPPPPLFAQAACMLSSSALAAQQQGEVGVEILSALLAEVDPETSRSVLGLLQGAVLLERQEKDALAFQLRSADEDAARAKEEAAEEIARVTKELGALTARLSEAKAELSRQKVRGRPGVL